MTRDDPHTKTIVTKAVASKILADVPYMNGFHFYTAYGNYMEETADNLCEFAEILHSIDEGSIGFHFPRGDFQKWIRETIEDKELAERIDAIKPTEDVEDLRNALLKVINTRMSELKELSAKR